VNRCILQGLSALHAAGYGHGDVRWPNIIELPPWHSEKYVLIDLEGVVKLGSTFTAPHIDKFPSWRFGTVLQNHQVYTAQSDLLQVGYMVSEASDRLLDSFEQDVLSGRINTIDAAISAVDRLLLQFEVTTQ
jgi:hypothetical protein